MANSPAFAHLYRVFSETGSLFMPPVLMEALLNKKNCSILLRVDKVILGFVNSPERNFTYSSRNNYERLLAHQLSAWYAMATESPHKACVEVIIRKPDGYVFPPSRMTLTQLVETVQEFQRVSEMQRTFAGHREAAAYKGFVGMPSHVGPSAEELQHLALQQQMQQQLLEAQRSQQLGFAQGLNPTGLAQMQQQARLMQQAQELMSSMALGTPPLAPMYLSAPSAAALPRPAPLPMLQDPFAAQQVQLEEALRLQASLGVRGIF